MFDVERSITLVPPDGEFALANYRTSHGIRPPFRLSVGTEPDAASDHKVKTESRLSRLAAGRFSQTALALAHIVAAAICRQFRFVSAGSAHLACMLTALCLLSTCLSVHLRPLWLPAQAMVRIRLWADIPLDKAASGLEVEVPLPAHVARVHCEVDQPGAAALQVIPWPCW
jgi:hypothetical protein